MTLIELLVVIVIITTVVAAAIPIMAPANVDRQLREATRSLNTFITGAQARAIATGRPFGIALKRLSQETNSDPNKILNPALDIHDDNGVCLEVFYAEEQPPFSGFTRNSMACIALDPSGIVQIRFVTRGETDDDGLPPGWDFDLLPPDAIQDGDVVEFGKTRFQLTDPQKQGPRRGADPNAAYLVTPTHQPAFLWGRPINDTGQQFIPVHDRDGNEIGAAAQPRAPYWSRPAPYKILRQPTITSDEPYQLPEGTAIDLRASGIGSDTFFHNADTTTTATTGLSKRINNSRPVIIMFAPEGRISQVSYHVNPSIFSSTPERRDVVDNVYLLVGRRENIPAPPAASDPTLNPTLFNNATTDEARAELREPVNWLQGDSRWVVIGSQSGRIVTIENGFVDLSATVFSTDPIDIRRNRQILAAREFTSEMSQLGGR